MAILSERFEAGRAQKSCRVVQRRRQRRRFNHRGSTARLEESKPSNQRILLSTPSALVELDQIGAAAEQHVLAVVHYFAGARMLVRRSAPSEIRTAFEKSHAKPLLARAHPAANPAKPPPTTATREFVPETGSSGQAFQEALGQNAELLTYGQADLAAEHVVFAQRNFIQQAPIDVNQHPKGRLAVFFDQRDQFFASSIILARAVGFHCQKRAKQHRIEREPQVRSEMPNFPRSSSGR